MYINVVKVEEGYNFLFAWARIGEGDNSHDELASYLHENDAQSEDPLMLSKKHIVFAVLSQTAKYPSSDRHI